MSSYVESLYEPILAVLTNAPMTSKEVSTAVEANYYTVRRAMANLENEGKIKKFDRMARGGRYTIGASNGPNTIIPQLAWQGQAIKATRYPSQLEIIEENYGAKGAAVIEIITEILELSEKISTGFALSTAEISLKRSRVRLHNIVSSLEDIRFLAMQVLDNPKFWNPIDLEKFPNDISWHDFRPPVGKVDEDE